MSEATTVVPLTAFQNAIDTWLGAEQQERGAVGKAAMMALEMFDKDETVKRRWILKATRTGNKAAQSAYEYIITQVKDRAKARGEKNPNMKVKRFMDAVKDSAGIAKPKPGSSGKPEIKFIEEAMRMLQNHLFKVDQGQCVNLQADWERFQEAAIDDGVLKADA